MKNFLKAYVAPVLKVKLYFFLITAFPCLGQAQELFSSIVVDSASFSPMPYVTVQVKNKPGGTITDEKGGFSINATRKDTLVLSFIGYYTVNYPLLDFEPGLIRLTEKIFTLQAVTVRSKAINPYSGMFDEQNAQLAARHNRFYYSKQKKEKRKLAWLREDNIQAKTYVDVMISSTELKEWLKKEYKLTDAQYYQVVARFNEKNSSVMYYITAGELVTLVKNFFYSACGG